MFHFFVVFLLVLFSQLSKLRNQLFFLFFAATETRYLNASNRELRPPNEAQLCSSDNPDQPQTDKKSLSSCQLLQFTFQELKSATGNFRPDSILGEGGFGYVFKGWIEENGTAPAKPGSGITVAVKSLKPDGLQGHREWVVSRKFICFSIGSIETDNVQETVV